MGQPCCTGATCGAGLGCNGVGAAATCVTCGGAGQPCCAGNTCAAAGCCDNRVCIASGSTCMAGGTCSAGLCSDCGASGQPCCTGPNGRFCTGAGLTCPLPNAAPVCGPCGGTGQPCCPGDSCRDGGCCLGVGDALETTCVAQAGTCSNNGGTCNAGMCSACGSSGQPCCSFYRCYASACGTTSCQ